MKYVMLSKKEMIVLTEVLGMHEMPANLGAEPEIAPWERSRIIRQLSKQGVIAWNGSRILPDKAIETFLKPMSLARSVMLINFGENDRCSFRATLYFSEFGITVLVERNEDEFQLVYIDRFERLLLQLPDIEDMGRSAGGKAGCGYVSYILMEEESSIVHCAKIDAAANMVRVVEGKRTPGAKSEDAVFVTDVLQYKAAFEDKLRGVYDAAGC